jgi:TetR/AcrR family transcriptional regulator
MTRLSNNKSAASSAHRPAKALKRSRDPVKSKQVILQAASAEFCQHGFSGARIERIATKSKSNMRMIYHYFGSKEGVYLAALEAAYARIRNQELTLDLTQAEPLEGIRTLIGFTFDFFATNTDVIALINNENTLKGRFLRKLTNVQAMTLPLIASISNMLERGNRQGIFRSGVDPLQFYVSLVSLSQLHILNRYTLSIIFDQNISDSGWLKQRRAHVEDVLLAYLTSVPRA